MNYPSRNLLLIYFLSISLVLSPFWALGIDESKHELAATVGDFLNPDSWFDAVKKNITIPLSKNQEVKIPSPQEALKGISPQLQEINKGVKEEAGVDLAKLIGWLARALKVFFQIIVNLLEAVANSFGP